MKSILPEMRRAVIFVIALLIVIFLVFLPGQQELSKKKRELQQLEMRVKLLQDENANLEEALTRLKNDPYYVEKRAREKLGIVRKGEFVYKNSNDR